MNAQPEVVCVGQAVVDCITRGFDRTPCRKNVFRAESISLCAGGDAFNEATVLTRLGHRVRLYCGLGEDAAGELILSALLKNGVDAAGVVRMQSLQTPVANIFVESGTARQSVSSPAAKLPGYTPRLAGTDDFQVLSLASLFRAPLDAPDTLLALVKAAKLRGACVCADTKLPAFRQLTLHDLSAVLPYIDYIFPNEDEAAYFSGRTDCADMARAFLDAGVRRVVVKRGGDGVYAMDGETAFTLPAFSVDAVDPTGAGDSFVAGFISELLHGGDFYHACRFGCAVAAHCVVSAGATAGAPDRGRVEAFLAANGAAR